MKVAVAPLLYCDLTKIWYAVKPISPPSLMFFTYTSISLSFAMGSIGSSVEYQIRSHMGLSEEDELVILSFNDGRQLKPYLTEEDSKVPFGPAVESLKIQIAAEKKLNEILDSPFVTHQVTKHLCDSLKSKGDPFDHKDLQYIDSLHEIITEKGKATNESD